MSARQFNESSQVGFEVLQFPMVEDLVNYTSKINPLLAMIPPEVIQERLQNQNSDTSKIDVTLYYLL